MTRTRIAWRKWGSRAAALLLCSAVGTSCVQDQPSGVVVTLSGSALGEEAALLERQIDRFEQRTPRIDVRIQATPDSADLRHQLYVQWLNARVDDPDVLQLDVVWAQEFAAAGWILSLAPYAPAVDAFFPATIAPGRWDGVPYALPWYADVGMLYWRTDLSWGSPESPRPLRAPPSTFEQLAEIAASAREVAGLDYGFVWQGARYEGLVCVFLEHLGGFGGEIMDDSGEVLLDSPAGVRALTFMRDSIQEEGFVPSAVLTWQEEPVRFAFQNGRAAFMRNWPYAVRPLEQDPDSRVAGRFSVAPMPSSGTGKPTATLGGSLLAINANTDHPDEAYALVAYLTEVEQMIERARVVGQFPTREALYEGDLLDGALPISPLSAREVIEAAVPRPLTPVYAELSEILQIHLHRALSGQVEPADALEVAAEDVRDLLDRVGLGPGRTERARFE